MFTFGLSNSFPAAFCPSSEFSSSPETDQKQSRKIPTLSPWIRFLVSFERLSSKNALTRRHVWVRLTGSALRLHRPEAHGRGAARGQGADVRVAGGQTHVQQDGSDRRLVGRPCFSCIFSNDGSLEINRRTSVRCSRRNAAIFLAVFIGSVFPAGFLME